MNVLEKGGLKGFLPVVRNLPTNMHLLVTSRHNAGIQREFEKGARLEIHASNKDVKRYIEARIEEHPLLVRYIEANPTLQSLERLTLAVAAGIFAFMSLPSVVLLGHWNAMDLI